MCSKGNPMYSYLKNLLVQTCIFNKRIKINYMFSFLKEFFFSFLLNVSNINFFPIYELLYLWKITLGQTLKHGKVNGFQSHQFCFLLFGKMYFHSTNVNYSPIKCKALSYNRHIIRYQDRSGVVLALKILSSHKYDNWVIQNNIEISRPIIWYIINKINHFYVDYSLDLGLAV